jgi:hypothetical protein
MATDPRRLRPGELCRLLNSTPLGEVTNERQLHRHRSRAGLRVGEGKHVDLLRYVAWMVETRHRPKPPPDPYAAVEDRARAGRQFALEMRWPRTFPTCPSKGDFPERIPECRPGMGKASP